MYAMKPILSSTSLVSPPGGKPHVFTLPMRYHSHLHVWIRHPLHDTNKICTEWLLVKIIREQKSQIFAHGNKRIFLMFIYATVSIVIVCLIRTHKLRQIALGVDRTHSYDRWH